MPVVRTEAAFLEGTVLRSLVEASAASSFLGPSISIARLGTGMGSCEDFSDGALDLMDFSEAILTPRDRIAKNEDRNGRIVASLP